ncbi:nicotinamide-nucleotide adenylyltransferase [Candidatus Acidianus copahuensis]|uniref:Nicotinamide-nucleotide adenylyltransferase n=1 Tax=Candidatus Acidianus copahuensis TaxID=1160895 RepID=A0A031LQ11_9CREN|nr:nicotinamide-nucleotide adenylyltransferase [Candidatus Acidianus copahuensis]EZQ04908.1 nicotinamide-nucleotide adenylyltransferase [Candidatus Acidianus copahuensis]
MRGLFPGRFQPFHFGHLSVVKWALERVDELVILIGSVNDSHTLLNPFTAGERIEMIRNSLVENEIDLRKIFIIPVSEILISSMWARQVMSLAPKFDVVFTRNPLVITAFKECGIKVIVPPSFNREKFSSTKIRKSMLSDDKTWEELLPDSVRKFIIERDLVSRIREIAKSDKQ